MRYPGAPLRHLLLLQEASVSLLLLLSNADVMVKGYCCTRDNLQQHLDCLGRLAPPSLTRVRTSPPQGPQGRALRVQPPQPRAGACAALGE